MKIWLWGREWTKGSGLVFAWVYANTCTHVHAHMTCEASRDISVNSSYFTRSQSDWEWSLRLWELWILLRLMNPCTNGCWIESGKAFPVTALCLNFLKQPLLLAPCLSPVVAPLPFLLYQHHPYPFPTPKAFIFFCDKGNIFIGNIQYMYIS